MKEGLLVYRKFPICQKFVAVDFNPSRDELFLFSRHIAFGQFAV